LLIKINMSKSKRRASPPITEAYWKHLPNSRTLLSPSRLGILEKTAGSFPGLLHRQLLLHVCPKSKEKGSFDKAWQSVINMLLRSAELIADSPCPLNGFVPLPTHLSYSFLFVPFLLDPDRTFPGGATATNSS
jgi:hypothetical protein